eukprot:2308372-Pleurochrysis_carterae.AAC.4
MSSVRRQAPSRLFEDPYGTARLGRYQPGPQCVHSRRLPHLTAERISRPRSALQSHASPARRRRRRTAARRSVSGRAASYRDFASATPTA